MTDQLVRVRSADGTEIVAARAGSGPPLVLVHGTTADRMRWAPVLPELMKHFTVYAMDRRGRGESGDADAYAVEREFEDVAALVRSVGEPAFLLGHSYGALCSLGASITLPDLRKLVLYEPPFSVDGAAITQPDIIVRVQRALAAGDRELALTTFMREAAKVPDKDLDVLRARPMWQRRIATVDTLPREETGVNTVRFDADVLAAMRTPTLLLLGGDSPPLFSDPIRWLDKTLPDARVVLMPGQQHAAIDTGTELFLSEVLSFLAAR